MPNFLQVRQPSLGTNIVFLCLTKLSLMNIHYGQALSERSGTDLDLHSVNIYFNLSGVVSMAFGQNRFCRSINRMDCTKGFIPNVICGDDGVSYPNE